MKKKLFVGTIIPVLACFATIGSGFSLWIFNDTNNVKEEGVIKINTTKVVGIGDITVTNKETSKIILDQKSTENGSTDTYKLNPDAKGCYIENPQDVSYKFDITKYEAYKDFIIGFDENETDLIFTTIIKIPAAVYKYVGFYCAGVPLSVAILNGVAGTSLTSDKEYVTFTYVDSFAQTGKTQADLETGFSFLTWKEHVSDEAENAHLTMSVQYNDGWVYDYNSSTNKYEIHYNKDKSYYPTSLSEYETMLDAIKGKSIEVTYKAEVKIKE